MGGSFGSLVATATNPAYLVDMSLVSVPAPDWGLSNRVCPLLPKRRLPAPAGLTKSNTMASASWLGARVVTFGSATLDSVDFKPK
jgi:hypothetical protein